MSKKMSIIDLYLELKKTLGEEKAYAIARFIEAYLDAKKKGMNINLSELLEKESENQKESEGEEGKNENR